MHFIIMGCGRVGATLATSLESHGHSVAVIDQNPEAFRRLNPAFTGQRVTGMGFDRGTLAQAGISDAYGFAAVSNGDNSNVLAARVARETFGISNVVARIYDADRAAVYQRLGIATVATVRWTADQVIRQLLPQGATDEYRDPSGTVALVRVDFHPGWIGLPLAKVESAAATPVAFLTRLGQAMIPAKDAYLQETDLLHLMIEVDRIPAVERLLTKAPAHEGERS